MKIAFATSDGVHLDQQFRRASRVAVYELGPAGPRLEHTFTFATDRSVKTDERLGVVLGAAIVFGVAFGPSSAARLAAQGIRPATAQPGTPIADLLARAAPRFLLGGEVSVEDVMDSIGA
jgi:nitrogen fixation protein NifX